MRELTIHESGLIHGGMVADPSLAHPIENPQSEFGKMIDDIAQMCDSFGSWLGGAIYDATH